MIVNRVGRLALVGALLLPCASAAGCVKQGRDINFADTQKLLVGVSMRPDAEALFGPPAAVTFGGGNMYLGWTYAHAGFYGTNGGSKQLVLTFGPDGKYLGVASMGASGNDVVGAPSAGRAQQ